jgi:hypothetical protein
MNHKQLDKCHVRLIIVICLLLYIVVKQKCEPFRLEFYSVYSYMSADGGNLQKI